MNKLSTDTARLISSLQVITRVDNVVKELVENALDAGATCVEVKFENYGLSKIEIRDNGSGIKQSDVEFVAQRHYTSKISCKEDLMSLHSYGFRGEALSSLCDVAEVFITTRTKDDTFSTKYSFNHKGVITATKPCHLVQGTTIVANNLFAKMPVRCQYYQTNSKKRQILKNTEDVLMSFALIHPRKRFSFLHNKCVIWQKPGCKDSRSTIETVLGSGIVAQMVQVEHTNEENQVELSAFIPTTQGTRHYRKASDRCFIYVNKRPVRDKEIEKVIKRHTTHSNSTSQSSKWPVFFLSIQIPADKVDPNVESDKSRVMINGKEAVLTAVDQMLTEAYASLPEEKEMDKENRSQDLSEAIGDPPSEGTKTVTKQSTNLDSERSESDARVHSVASQWSKGHCAKDVDGETVQPVRILAGHHGRPIPEIPRRANPPLILLARKERGDSAGDIPVAMHSKAPSCPATEDSFDLNEIFNFDSAEELSLSSKSDIIPQQKNPTLKQSFLNLGQDSSRLSHPTVRTPVRSNTSSSSSSKSPTKKRKASSTASDDVRHASLILKWASESENSHKQTTTSSPVLSEVSAESRDYSEGQVVDLKFDLAKMKENLFYKEDYAYAEKESYSAVGVLKDIKAGVVIDNAKRELFLVNLIRLQETKLFWSLMENHAIRTRELPNPIFIPTSSLTMEEKDGLKKLAYSTPNLENPDIEYTDERICKNGFKVKLVKGPDGLESLEVSEMTNAISYYNIDDLKSIFRKIGSSESKASLSDSRPFKAVQFLQAEAVRMSYSLSFHSTVLENLKVLDKHLTKDFEHWKCFHSKPIFHSVFRFSKS